MSFWKTIRDNLLRSHQVMHTAESKSPIVTVQNILKTDMKIVATGLISV